MSVCLFIISTTINQAVFDAEVDAMEEYQPPSAVLTAVNARLASHAMYTDQWNRYEPLKNDVVDQLVRSINVVDGGGGGGGGDSGVV